MKRSIRHWLIAIMVCFAVVPLLVLGSVLSWQYYQTKIQNIIEQQEKVTALTARIVALFLHEQENRLDAFVRSNDLPGLPPESLKELFSRFLSVNKDEEHGYVFEEAGFFDDRGRCTVLASRIRLVAPGECSGDMDLTDLGSPANKKQFYYGPVYFSESTGEPMMKINLPIRDLRTSKLKGVFAAEINLSYMWGLVDEIKVRPSGTAYIVNQAGRVIVHPDPTIALQETTFDVPAQSAVMGGIGGMKSIIVASPLYFGGRKMALVTQAPFREAQQQIIPFLFHVIVFILLALCAAGSLGLVIVRKVVRPIERLAETARGISSGDLTRRAELDRRDELGGLAESFNEMTARLIETIYALEKEKNFVQHVIDSLAHPFYVIDVKDYTIKLANKASGFSHGGEQQTCYQLTHLVDHPCDGKEHPCPIEEILRTKKPAVLEHAHPVKGGVKTFQVMGYPIFDERGEIIQIIEYNIDITERRNLEKQFMQSQKLEAIGILAGGVAHDFNNLLSGIIGYSELALMELPEGDPLRKKIEIIYQAGNQSASLTRQLLAFSRKQMIETRIINLNDIINSILKMLNRLIGEDIQIETNLPASLGNIDADPGQIEQIIMNLVVNARDAMPTGGKIFIETENVVLDKMYCRAHENVNPGSYVMLVVTDTGHGMSRETRRQVFDPFFTTKEKGKGTGLGLSTVYGIVKQHGGHIYLYSEPGCGTTFKIYFPEVEGKVTARPNQGFINIAAAAGVEAVMVVDDEASVRELIVDTLRPLGYIVYTAESGEDALVALSSPDKKIDLLLTDVILGGMNGRMLAEKVAALQPGVQVLFMSGYTDNVVVHHGVLDENINFISKPIFPSMLSRKIRELLDS